MGAVALGRTPPGLGDGRGVVKGEGAGVGGRARGGGGGQVVISPGVQAEMRPEMMKHEASSGPMIRQMFMMHFKSLEVYIGPINKLSWDHHQ